MRLVDHHLDQRIVAVGRYPGVDDGKHPRHDVVAGDEHETEIDRSQHLRAEDAAAFQALAVTEKMTRDAFSLGRALKIGVSALFAVAILIAGIFVLFSRRANKEANQAYAIIAQLERRAHGLLRQRQPEEDGLAGAVTGLADGSGIDDDGIPAAGFERFVERDGSERAHTVEEARPMGVTEDADV